MINEVINEIQSGGDYTRGPTFDLHHHYRRSVQIIFIAQLVLVHSYNRYYNRYLLSITMYKMECDVSAPHYVYHGPRYTEL